MEIEKIVCGIFHTNTYMLSVDDKIMLIDPACKAEKLYPLLENKHLLAVLLTHGHFDHIKACDDLFDKYQVPIYINPDDEEMARDKKQGDLFNLPFSPVITREVVHLKEGLMKIGPFEFEVLFTPGHSRGSTCFVFKDDIFTGDTLFKGSVGRTDLYNGDQRLLKDSLRVLKGLNPDLIIHPGHDEESTLADEIAHNPYL